MVESSLQECGDTLNKLYAVLQDLNGTTAGRFGVLRRPIKQVRLNMKMKDIGDFQQQVHSHYSGMQLTLGTINVYVAPNPRDVDTELTDLSHEVASHCTATLLNRTSLGSLAI
jgi:phage host-nuclease inhibitor protein Gam